VKDLFAGMSAERIAIAIAGLLECLTACALAGLVDDPFLILLCGIAATLGIAGFALAWED
jgi:hypothetical protein